MNEADRLRLRGIFGTDAERYDRVRPGCPAALLTDLRRLAGLSTGSRVLEIGCGTGQATVPLARLGCTVTAVELDPAMAAVARRNLAGFPAVDVVVAAFEEWPLPAEPYDLVLSVTAFHWLDPAVRMMRCADAVRPGGRLAVVSTEHVAGGTGQFFVDVQDCYERFDPQTPPSLRLTRAADVPDDAAELVDSGRFAEVLFRRYEWSERYRAGRYLDLLLTYSGHLALPEPARRGLLDCIGEMIDDRYGGAVTKRYLTRLALGRRVP